MGGSEICSPPDSTGILLGSSAGPVAGTGSANATTDGASTGGAAVRALGSGDDCGLAGMGGRLPTALFLRGVTASSDTIGTGSDDGCKSSLAAGDWRPAGVEISGAAATKVGTAAAAAAPSIPATMAAGEGDRSNGALDSAAASKLLFKLFGGDGS